MRKYICRMAGCKSLIDKPGYCDKHKKENSGKSKSKPFENATRANQGLYQTYRWRALAKQHLEKQNYCVCCGSTEDLTVNHIIPPRGDLGLFYDPDNLDTLCARCHRWITNMEIRERNSK